MSQAEKQIGNLIKRPFFSTGAPGFGLVIFAILAMLHCSPPDDEAAVQSVSPDVEDIHYTLKDVVTHLPLAEKSYLYGPNSLHTTGVFFAIADEKNSRVVVADTGLTHAVAIGTRGRAPGEFYRPIHACMHQNTLFALDFGNRRVQVFQLLANELQFVSSFSIGAVGPHSNFAVDQQGFVYVPDVEGTNLISIYNQEGRILDQFGNRTPFPEKQSDVTRNLNFQIHIDSTENVYVVYGDRLSIAKYDTKRQLAWKFDLQSIPAIQKLVANTQREQHRNGMVMVRSIIGSSSLRDGTLYVMVPKVGMFGFDTDTGTVTKKISYDFGDYHMHAFSFNGNSLYFVDSVYNILGVATDV